MCQIWLRSDGRVERGGGIDRQTARQTDRQRDTAALYMVDYAVIFKGEMRIALRTLRYIMVHYVRAVSNITTVVFDADDSLHVIML